MMPLRILFPSLGFSFLQWQSSQHRDQGKIRCLACSSGRSPDTEFDRHRFGIADSLRQIFEWFRFQNPAAGDLIDSTFVVELAVERRKLMAKLNINGTVRDVAVEADTPLLWVIREHVGLTGTKYGCGVAQCGACSVHINDELQRSCSIAVGDVKPTDVIVTIEGLSVGASHPVQKAWASVDVPQCGYCQSGQIMAAAALLKKNPRPSGKDIDEAMTNICRCGTYQRIRQAVNLAADAGTAGRRAQGG
jgi:isoquinoline 1-oxidoreductase alpha subunit